MYAIIETGGKQYRIQAGDVIEVELLKEEKNIEFKNILVLSDGTNIKVGSPYVQEAVVKGEILEVSKGPKVIAYKYKKRKNYHRKKGHRQKYSKVKITEIK